MEDPRGLTEDEAVAEAGRCLSCKKPRCIPACPIPQDVPGYVDAIAREDFKEALRIIMRDNPLPRTCAMVCPHPCQGECLKGRKERAINISGLKGFAAWAVDPKELGIEPGSPTGRTVGVIGSGPAGLSLAYHLALRGHRVTIYEEMEVPGGMLAVGIPEFRLPKALVQEEIDFIKGLGVEIRTGTRVGSIDELDHDAVFIGVGAHVPVRLDLGGSDLDGVHYGIAFLEAVNQGMRPRLGRRVAVIGGGNAAIDAARTALRVGAREVTVLYRRSEKEMPAYREEVEAAEREGVRFRYLTSPVCVLGEGGSVEALECIRMELGEPDASGRRRPVAVEGSEFTIPVDSVILAIGQYPDVSWVEKEGVRLTRRRTIRASRGSCQTSREGVFAGGDCVTGPGIVAGAIGAGRRAAMAMDRYLREKKG
ncbi:MAG: NAD(P)-dependent oxidoreductase [Euryarchaeota archaeon]|nr:NAD(P)-dependent oxidoreductase [Euryarchaeota archaeon]